MRPIHICNSPPKARPEEHNAASGRGLTLFSVRAKPGAIIAVGYGLHTVFTESSDMRTLHTLMGFTTLACICGIAAGKAGAAGGIPSNEDLRHVKTLLDPRISPDGSRILVHMLDATADGAR